eukprot:scaffold71214_cov37-Cyclotella_meneghiniana.AAC.1
MIDTSARQIAREALAEFIRDASKSIQEVYWFVVRGESDSSLCTHTLLSLEEYAELLYHAELLTLGKRGYEYSEETWRSFLREEGLFDNVSLGIAEVTKNKVFVHKLMTPGSTTDEITRRDLLFLRIGRYEEDGLTTNLFDQLKHNVRPPSFNHKLRTAGRKFKLAIRSIVGTITSDTSDAIVDWVNLPALREFYDPDADVDHGTNVDKQKSEDNDHSTNVDKHKSEDSDTTNKIKQQLIVEPQKQIVSSPVQRTTPAGNMLIPTTSTPPTSSTTKQLPVQNDKFPLLSSLNIDLMNRDSGIQ